MSLHLVTGYTTEHRSGDPTVLYCGPDGNAAAQALREADPAFSRIEKALVVDSYKIARKIIAPHAVAVQAASGAGPEPEVESAAPIPAADVEPDEPQLLMPDSEPKKSRK